MSIERTIREQVDTAVRTCGMGHKIWLSVKDRVDMDIRVRVDNAIWYPVTGPVWQGLRIIVIEALRTTYNRGGIQ